jgi:carnosine N-methyltransferase
MVSGDFLTCYRPSVAASSFDAVATNFFLDTAADPLAYIDIIWSSLKPGGIWINFGPLLWHFDGKGREGQGGVELTLEEVLVVTEMRGFKIVERESNVLSYYTSDRESMGRWAYQCEFWVAEKPL